MSDAFKAWFDRYIEELRATVKEWVGGMVKEQLDKSLGLKEEDLREIKQDLTWAGKALRKARKHFWKGYVLMIAGTILGGVERILPSGPLRTAVALASVASLGASALTYWLIMR